MESEIDSDEEDRIMSQVYHVQQAEKPEDGVEDSETNEERAIEVVSDGRRYFTGDEGLCVCFNCGKRGHKSRECQEKNATPCCLCSKTDHARTNCPDEVCHRCKRLGHVARKCRNDRGRPPPRWRLYLYHGTSLPTPPQIHRAVQSLTTSCYYCASQTHFGDNCKQKRIRTSTCFAEPTASWLRTCLIPTPRSGKRPIY